MDANGQYVYLGTHVKWKSDRKKELQVLWTYAILLAAAALLAGCFPGSGLEDSALALLPYAGEVGCALYLIWKLISLTWAGGLIRTYTYEATVPKMPGMAKAAMVLSLVSCAGHLITLIYSLIRGNELEVSLWGVLILYVLLILAAAAAYGFAGRISRLEWDFSS